MISSFEALHTALLRGRSPEPVTDSALLRARADALLTTLEDPAVVSAAARVLEQLVRVIQGEHEEHRTDDG
ncbi:hypothetical protein [Streptomyces xiamenensis]|uniref:hypothetical protein n=1 Tax=Streptomyces xiamenensis TaxID=408015 RepID=UPI0037D105DE